MGLKLLDTNLSLHNSSLPEGCWPDGKLDEEKFTKEMRKRFNYAVGLRMFCYWNTGTKGDYKCTPFKKKLLRKKYKKEFNEQYFKNLDRELTVIEENFSKYEKPYVIFSLFHKYRKHDPWFQFYLGGWAHPEARVLREKYINKIIEVFEAHKNKINILYETVNETPYAFIKADIEIFKYLSATIPMRRIFSGLQKIVKKNNESFRNTKQYRYFRDHFGDEVMEAIKKTCYWVVHKFINNDVAKILKIKNNIPNPGKYRGWFLSMDGDKINGTRPPETISKFNFCMLFKNSDAMRKMFNDSFFEAFTYKNKNAARWVTEEWFWVFGKKMNKNVDKYAAEIEEPGPEPIPEPKPKPKENKKMSVWRKLIPRIDFKNFWKYATWKQRLLFSIIFLSILLMTIIIVF